MSVEFRLLGPLEIWVDGRPVVVGAPQTRTVLALLLTNANQVLPVSRLIDALWPQQPPPTARETIHFHIYRLRKALAGVPNPATEGPGILTTHGSAYRLRVGAGELDTQRFAELAAEGHTAAAAGDLEAAWERLGAALELWRGPALTGFTEDGWAQAEIARLNELHMAATEQRMQAGLELGRHGELVGELEALVARHPLRERLRVLLMLALYRSGRTAEALAVYRSARTRFVEEVGVEPAAELARVHQQILNHDPALKAPPPPGPGHRSPAHAHDQPDPPRPAGGVGKVPPPAGPPPASVASLLAASTPPPASPPGGSPAPSASVPGPLLPEAVAGEERRLVSLVVVTHPGVGSGDPEDLRRADTAALRAAGRAAQRYRGVVHPGEGLLVGVVVLGAQAAREDDPERAVRAALEITAALPSVRCTVTTGLAFTPQITSPGGLLPAGEAVLRDAEEIVAAAQGPGRVLVTHDTYQHTREVIDYQPATGGDGVWTAVGPRARPTALQVGHPGVGLVGRETELTALHGRYQQMLNDPWVGLVTVLGAPGIGKTRLVAELAKLLHAAPELVAWRVGRPAPAGQEDGVGGVFWALAEIVAAEAGIQPGDPPATIASRLAQTVTATLRQTAEHARVVRALRVLLRLEPAGDLDQAGLFAGWRQFFFGLARRRPLVLVVEDLHRADDALLDFVEGLLTHPARLPLLVVATARTELLARRPGWPGRSRHTLTLELPRSPQTRRRCCSKPSPPPSGSA